MRNQYDIVIVGAGMVGSTLACALGKTSLHIAILEAQVPELSWEPATTDLRVSALTAASQQIFKSLGVWNDMAAMRVSPFREMHVWDAAGQGVIHFDSADIGEERLGHIVENRVIQVALIRKFNTLDNVDLLSPVRVLSMDRDEGQVRIGLEGGQMLTARLVIGADGGHSHIRSLAGITTQGWSYDQRAVVTTVKTARDHGETAWQRFMPDGPLAFLPLNDGRSSIVWSTRPAHAEELLAMQEEEFMQALTLAFESRLGQILECGPRAAFPLSLQHANRYVMERLALIGDAAHTIHPLAGQGVNLGLLDAAALAEVISDANDKGQDIGALHVLRRYERWRKGDNMITMAVMDGFKRLFGTSFVPVRTLRNIGLDLTNSFSPLKHHIMQYAMGLKGDLPRQARPG